MRYLLTFLFFILTSSAYGNENLDGKALDCTNAKAGYFVFGKQYVSRWYLYDGTPLKITKRIVTFPYETYSDVIRITRVYTLRRKTLDLIEDNSVKLGKCKPTTHAEIEKIFNKKIDKLKASMKGNKF